MEVSKTKLKNETKKIQKETEKIIRESTLLNTMCDLITKQTIESKYEPICNKIIYTGRIIKKIIHIADIHIRLSSRHKEYEEVFEEFYNELVYIKLSEPDCIVCLCGDLLESKDELKPDTIIQTWNFLKNISSIFPLILISGNHDRIEQNDNKIDSIQSIINERPIKNIHYLRDSGVHIYENIIFGVSSIVDKYTLHIDKLNKLLLETYPEIYKLPYIKKIGLYHGGVENATNNFNFILPHCKNISDFGSYDYILLGDIHKFQYLNKEKTIAYSSSMISQNFGETDDNHGYLEWDLSNNWSKFHILYNRYAFNKINLNKIINTNLNLNQNQNIDVNLLKKYLPRLDSGYLKIEYESESIKIFELKEQINNIYPRLSIIFNQIYDKNKSIKNEINSEVKNELIPNNDMNMNMNINVNINMNKLIKEYLRKKEDISDDILIDNILEYFDKIINKSLHNKIEYIGNEWKILFLSFDYMFGYGANNVIDFTKYPNNEIIGIFGDNAIGKSSLIDIISFMLFSKTTREDTIKDIININSNSSKGLIIIESGGKKYMIQKSCYHRSVTKTTKLNSHIETKMFMYKLIPTDDNTCYTYNNKYYQLEALTEENRYKTTSILESIIGDLQNFILTSVLLQGTNETFKNKDNKQKKEFLCKILNIDHYATYEKEIIDHHKKIKQQVIYQQKLIESISNESVQSLLELNNNINSNTLTNLSISRETLSDIIAKEDNEKSLLYSKLINLKQDIQIKNDNEKNQILSEIATKSELLDNILFEIKSYEQNIIDNEILIDKLSLIIDEDNINKTYNMDLLIIESERTIIHNQIDDLNKSLYDNQLVKINSDLNINNTNLAEYKQKLLNDKLLETKLKNDIEENQQLIDNLKLISQKSSIIEENKLYQEENKKQITNLNELIKNEIQQMSNLTYKHIDSDQSLDQLNTRLIELNEHVSDLYIEEIFNNKLSILEDYEKFKINKKELLYEKINNLKINQSNISSSIDEIIRLLDIVLDPNLITDNSIVNSYNELIKFETFYNENILLKEHIMKLINDINYNKQIEEQIIEKKSSITKLEKSLNDINNKNRNIALYDLLQDEINIEIKYKQNINELGAKLLVLSKNICKLNEYIINIETNNQKQIVIDKLNRQMEVLERELINNKILGANLESYKQVILLKEEQQQKITYTNNILSCRKKILDLKEEYVRQHNLILKLDKNVNDYNLYAESIESNNNTKIKIEHIQKNLSNKLDELNSIDKQIIIAQNQLKINEEKISKIEISTIELERLKSESIIYSYLVSMTSVNGIQLYLLNEYLDRISYRINNILEPFIHKNIQLVLNKDRIDMNIVQDQKQIYTLSGMESFMLDLSMIIIINEISQIPKSNIMFIDESISVLDKNRIDNINDLFIFMKEYFNQVFMITHMKQVKSSINYSLDIKKSNNYSIIYNLGNMIDLR
jgi:DNA repair exonuclease SbcCD ATPase subunit/predicted MPP superfamily phosphohydrolase